MKFSCNISTMFQEFPFLERFTEARNNGFKFVEIQSPYEYSPDDLIRSKGDIDCILVNSFCGKNEMGCAAIPGKDMEFATSTQEILRYYDALGFKKLHILSGLKNPNYTTDEHMEQLINNLNGLVEGDYLENRNLIGLIEPISSDVKENYFLNSFDMAIEILERVKSDQIKLLLDIYHLHKITGDVKKNLEKYYPYAGHIQISQDPGRTEPFCPGGKIDYDFVFEFLKDKNHQDAIGLEYFPSGSTVKSLEWIKNYA